MADQNITINLQALTDAFEKGMANAMKTTSGLQQSTEQLNKQTQKSFKAMEAASKGLQKSIGGLGNVFKMTLGFVAAEVIGELGKALKRLVGDLVLTSKATPGFIKAFTGVESSFNKLLDSMGSLITTNPLVVDGLNAFAAMLTKVADWIDKNRVAIITFIANGLNVLIRTFNFLSPIIEFAAGAILLLVGSMQQVQNEIYRKAAPAFKLFLQGLSAIVGVVNKDWAQAIDRQIASIDDNIKVHGQFADAIADTGKALINKKAVQLDEINVTDVSTRARQKGTQSLKDYKKAQEEASKASQKAADEQIKKLQQLQEALAKARGEQAKQLQQLNQANVVYGTLQATLDDLVASLKAGTADADITTLFNKEGLQAALTAAVELNKLQLELNKLKNVDLVLVQQQLRLNESSIIMKQSEAQILTQISKKETEIAAFRTKMQEDVTKKRIQQYEDELKFITDLALHDRQILNNRAQVQNDYAERLKDIYRTTEDDKVALVEKAQGLEAKLNYLHQQRLLDQLQNRLAQEKTLTLDQQREILQQIVEINKALDETVGEAKIKIELDKSPFEQAIDRVGVAWDKLVTKFGPSLSEGFDWSLKKLSDGFDWISEKFNNIVGDMFGGDKAVVGVSWEMPDWIKDIGKGFAEAGKEVWDGLKTATNWMVEKGSALWDQFKEVWEFGSAVVDVAVEGFKAVWEVLKAVWDYGVMAFKGAVMVLEQTVGVLSGAWIEQLNGVLLSLGSMPENFYKAFQELDATIQTLVGPEGIAKSLVLLDNLPAIINQILENFPKLVDGIVQAIPKIVQVLVNNIGPIFTELANAISKIIPELAKAIPQIIKAIVDALPQITKAIADAAPSLVTGILQGITELIKKLPEILKPIIDALPAILESIMKELPNIIKALVAAIPQIIRSIVDALPALVETFAENIDEIVIALVEGLAEGAGDIVEGLIDSLLIKGGLERIVVALIKAIPRVAWALVKGTVNGLIKAAGSIGGAIVNGFKSIGKGGTLASWGEKIKGGFQKFGSWFDLKGSDMRMSFQNVGKWFEDSGDKIRGAFQRVGKWFEDSGDKIRNAFQAVGSWFEDSGAKIRAAFQKVGTWFEDAGTKIKDAFQKVGTWFEDAGTKIKDAFQAVGTWFEDAGTKIKEAFQAVGDWFANAGKTIWENFLLPIGNFFADAGKAIWENFLLPIGNFFADAGKAIWNGLKAAWEAASQLFTQAGQAIWNGFKALWDSMVSIFKSAGEAIWNGLKAVWEAGTSVFSKAGTWIVDGLKAAWNTVGDLFSNAGQSIWNGLKSLVEKGGSIFANLGRSIWDALKSGLSGIGDIFKDALDAINPMNLLDKLFTIDWKGRGTVEKALGIDVPWANFAAGGMAKVPGTARYSGDDLRNDTVPALLSPGEFVIPRSLTSNPQFMEGLKLLASVPSMGSKLQFRYSWDDFENDLSSLDPTNPGNVWDQLGDFLGGMDPWEYIKQNFFGWMRSGIGLAHGGYVDDNMGKMRNMAFGGSVPGRSVQASYTGGPSAPSMMQFDYDKLAEAMSRVNITTSTNLNGREIARSVRTEHNRGFRSR